MCQLKLPFLQACRTAAARGLVLHPLREIYPGVRQDDMFILSAIDCNGGACSPGDVVSFFLNGQIHIGQLLLSVGVKTQYGTYLNESIIARWQRASASLSVGSKWVDYKVSGEDAVKVQTECIDTVLLWSLAADAASCMIYLPAEIRPTQ